MAEVPELLVRGAKALEMAQAVHGARGVTAHHYLGFLADAQVVSWGEPGAQRFARGLLDDLTRAGLAQLVPDRKGAARRYLITGDGMRAAGL